VIRLARRRRERGAALIEVALVTPILFLAIFAIIEFGVVFRDQLTVQDAVSDAARMGAILGPDFTATGTNADYEIINALRQGVSSLPVGWIDRIVIFKASGGGAGDPVDQVPTTCRNGTSMANRCNVYSPTPAFAAVYNSDADYFNCAVNSSSPACNWRPETRNDGPEPNQIEYVGVYVRIDRDALTGMFGSRFTIERAAIVRLEPGQVGL
jgi:hypothetical protein